MAGCCSPRVGGDARGAMPVPVLVLQLGCVSQVLPDMPSLPEAEQHLRPLPVHLPAHPAAPDQVSLALHIPRRSPVRQEAQPLLPGCQLQLSNWLI